MYIRLRVLHRLGLLGPVLRLHRRIDPRWFRRGSGAAGRSTARRFPRLGVAGSAALAARWAWGQSRGRPV